MSTSTIATEAESLALTITRRIKAPRERVFAAFTSAEAIGQWFGPGDVKVIACAADFRVGGRYRLTVRSPEMGEDMSVSGEYREIIEPEKIAYTWKWEDDEEWTDVESLVTFEFGADGDETDLRLTHTGFPAAQNVANHTQGWSGCLEKLNAQLTGEPLQDCGGCCH